MKKTMMTTGNASPYTKTKTQRYFIKLRFQYQKILMVIPAIIFLAVFSYYPMHGIVLAFKRYKPSQGVWGSQWIGLEHFRVILKSPQLTIALGNTLKISLLNLLVVFPAPIILALFINELRSKKLAKIVQTVSYLPHFVSWVIVAGMVYNMLSANGLVNQLIRMVTGREQPIYFLSKEKIFLPLLVITSIWKEVGWESIIYLAALSGVDPQLEESAVIDAAHSFQRMYHISLPAILPSIVILFICALSNILHSNFDQVFLLQNAAIIGVSETLDTYVYKVGISQGQFDYGQAISLFKSIISVIVLIIANKVSNKVTEHGLW